jgi:hypothetical protein
LSSETSGRGYGRPLPPGGKGWGMIANFSARSAPHARLAKKWFEVWSVHARFANDFEHVGGSGLTFQTVGGIGGGYRPDDSESMETSPKGWLPHLTHAQLKPWIVGPQCVGDLTPVPLCNTHETHNKPSLWRHKVSSDLLRRGSVTKGLVLRRRLLCGLRRKSVGFGPRHEERQTPPEPTVLAGGEKLGSPG